MGSVTIDTLKSLYKVLKADFLKSFENGEPMAAPEFVMETTSNGSSETYGWLGQVPQMQKWVDERKIRGLTENKYEIFNDDYEATLGVKRTDIEDDKLGAIKVRIADLARRASTHPWKLIVDAIVAGTSALCYDGQAFFSASHVEGNNQTAQTNIVTGTGTSLAQVKADFNSAVAKLQSFKDDQNEPYNEGELSLVIVANPAMRGVMEELFKATVISQTTNVLVGAVKKIHYTSRLTDTNDWYLFEVGSQMKPFIKQTRKPIEFSALEQGSEGAFMRKMFYYGVDYRIGVGYGLWQKAIKVTNT